MVVGKERRVHEWVPGVGGWAIRVDELAAAILEGVVGGIGEGRVSRTLDNAPLMGMGKKLLKGGK